MRTMTGKEETMVQTMLKEDIHQVAQDFTALSELEQENIRVESDKEIRAMEQGVNAKQFMEWMVRRAMGREV